MFDLHSGKKKLNLDYYELELQISRTHQTPESADKYLHNSLTAALLMICEDNSSNFPLQSNNKSRYYKCSLSD